MESIWSRLSWPQVAALAILVIGAVAALVGVPLETWQGLPWESIAGFVAVVVAGGASATLGPLVRPRSSSTPPPAPGTTKAEPPSRTNRHGYVDHEALALLVAWAVAMLAATWAAVRSGLIPLFVLALCLAGCGVGAIQVQARAATVASVALEGVHRVAMSETERRLDACADVACTQDVETSMAPIGLAYEAARVALVAWVEALQLAQVAGEDGDVLSALLTAGARWLSLWDPLAAALAGVGLEVPRLPPLVTGLLGGVPR